MPCRLLRWWMRRDYDPRIHDPRTTWIDPRYATRREARCYRFLDLSLESSRITRSAWRTSRYTTWTENCSGWPRCLFWRSWTVWKASGHNRLGQGRGRRTSCKITLRMAKGYPTDVNPKNNRSSERPASLRTGEPPLKRTRCHPVALQIGTDRFQPGFCLLWDQSGMPVPLQFLSQCTWQPDALLFDGKNSKWLTTIDRKWRWKGQTGRPDIQLRCPACPGNLCVYPRT